MVGKFRAKVRANYLRAVQYFGSARARRCPSRLPPGVALVARLLGGDGAAEQRSARPSRGAVTARRTRSSRAARFPDSDAFAATAVRSRVD